MLRWPENPSIPDVGLDRLRDEARRLFLPGVDIAEVPPQVHTICGTTLIYPLSLAAAERLARDWLPPPTEDTR